MYKRSTSSDSTHHPPFFSSGNVINRPGQLPGLAHTNGSTSGIWAPSIRSESRACLTIALNALRIKRFHNGTFWVVTTLVYDDRAQNDSSRWDNVSARLSFLLYCGVSTRRHHSRSSSRRQTRTPLMLGLIPSILLSKAMTHPRIGMRKGIPTSSARMRGIY